MTKKMCESVIDQARRCLESGMFETRFPSWLASNLENPVSIIFQHELKKNRQAGQELIRFHAANDRMETFAAAIAPAVKGLLEFAAADKDGDFTCCTRGRPTQFFPNATGIAPEDLLRIAVFNPDRTEKANLLAGSSFDPLCYFELRAAAIDFGTSRLGRFEAQLSLIVPLARSAPQPLNGYNVLSIDLDGELEATTYSAHFQKDSLIKAALGHLPAYTTSMASGHGIDKVMGFSNARFHLANSVSRLGAYLGALAKTV